MNKLAVTAAMAVLSLGVWCAETNSAPASAVGSAVAELETRTFVLKYAKATEVADSLNRLFGQRTRINRQREIVVLVTMGLVDSEQPELRAGMPKNAFLSREYLDGTKKEPGDNTKEELEENFDRARSLFR